MEINDSLRQLDVTLYGNTEPISDTLSKCRVRIFYKGLNRNRTFISEDFAAQLIDSLPYAPVKGIFDKEEMDYGDHGKKNSDGQIYGVVSENPNFAWEKHLDADGVEREYACADVILYTALYPEANLISGKPQSMEIHRKGLEGEWKIWDGDMQPYFEFQKGHLLGLQVLGDEVEPCFEGSAFFSLYKDAKDLYDYIKNSKVKEESKKMEKNLFKLSDGDKADLLFDALNTAESNFTVVCTIYDDYAIAYDTGASKYIRAYYTKDNEANTVTVDRVEDCYIVDVTAEELTALNAMKAVGSFTEIQAKLDEQSTQIETFTADKNSLTEQLTAVQAELDEFKKKEEEEDPNTNNAKDDDKKDGEGKKDESDGAEGDDDEKKKGKTENALSEEAQAEIESYKNAIAEKDAEIARLNNSINDINNEKSELEAFKKAADTEKKNAIINEFSAHLTEDQITEFNSKMDDYSVEDFKKEVCFAAYNSDSSILNKDEGQPDLIYKNTQKETESGVLALLRKHKGGNK